VYGVILLLAVAAISLIITRVATIALTETGLARPTARFQARSALTGVGFTTTESEAVVAHPVRRRIIMALMLLGSVGLATGVAGILAGLLRAADAGDVVVRGLLLVGGLLAIYATSLSQAVDRRLSRAIGRVLRRFTDLDTRDYAALLHVSGNYAVAELFAQPDGWLAGQTLGDLRLRDEGILVLGVIRADHSYLGVPDRTTRVEPNDTLVAYGDRRAIAALSARAPGAPGDDAHRRASTQRRTADPGSG
jgi:hypothetical protein